MTAETGKCGNSRCRGQVLTEYAFMLVLGMIFVLMFFVLLAAFSEHGARLIGLISWEPTPSSRAQMEKVMKGNL